MSPEQKAIISARLRPFVSEPTTLDEVLAFVASMNGPVFGKEVSDGLGMSRELADRALRRLEKKGKLTRYKIPAKRHGYSHKTGIIPGGSTHLLWLYSLAGSAE